MDEQNENTHGTDDSNVFWLAVDYGYGDREVETIGFMVPAPGGRLAYFPAGKDVPDLYLSNEAALAFAKDEEGRWSEVWPALVKYCDGEIQKRIDAGAKTVRVFAAKHSERPTWDDLFKGGGVFDIFELVWLGSVHLTKS